MTAHACLGSGMSVGLLVSVCDPAEARLARACGASLIDAKDPRKGALGALAPEMVAAIAEAARDGRTRPLVSAVAGEPEGVEAMTRALQAMVPAGADLLKVAVTAELRRSAGETKAALSDCQIPVIAVLFAEDGLWASSVPILAEAGFAGAMIDTRIKDGRRLPDLLTPPELAGFAGACRAAGLLSGLAGSLSVGDIPTLARHRPDYLGFRGGLCSGRDRTGPLDGKRIREAARLLAATTRREAA